MAGTGMIDDAFAALVSGDYTRSQELLATISKHLPASSKSRGTAHNSAVVALYASGGRSRKEMNKILRLALVTVREEDLPSADDSDNLIWVCCENSGLLDVVYTACGTVHMYNLCVIAYNSDRMTAAKNIGTVLYDNIEAMEDWLALRVSFLLVDVHLMLGGIADAANAARYAERILPGFKDDAKKNGGKLFPVAPEKWGAKNNAVLQPPISYDDARHFIAVYKDRIRAANPQQQPQTENADVEIDGYEGAAAVRQLVRARIEADDEKILAILDKFKADVSPGVFKKLAPVFFNTLGIVHHRMGLPALACCYFERSRAEFLNATATKDVDSNSDVGVPGNARVAYNLGLQYMRLEKYKEALGMFSLCARTNEVLATTSPYLWIRMTECCVAEAHKQVMYSQGVSLEGCGRGRRLKLETKEFMSSEGKDKRLFSYATICARTCLKVLDASNDNKLRSVVLAMLAYSLLEVDAKAALAACNELVDVSSGIDTERAVLGRLYGAEALCMLGRPNDAVERLAPLLAMRASAHAGIRDGAFVNVALAHSMRGDMATAVRAAKAALKVTAGSPPGTNNANSAAEEKASYRREALLVATYVFLREGDLVNARASLHSLRSIPVPRQSGDTEEEAARKKHAADKQSAATESNAQKDQTKLTQ